MQSSLAALGNNWYATDEDLLNPHDLEILNSNMHFNYEDGYLNGLMAARMAILASSKLS